MLCALLLQAQTASSIIIIIIRAHKFKQARVRGAGVARWGTWLAGKGKEVSFETAFKRTNGW